MLIQVILLTTFLSLVLYLARQHTIARGFRILVVLVALAACYVVAFPKVTNTFAAFAGVGRGVDLIIYLSTTAIAFLITGLYIRSRNSELRIARLVQRLAIQDHRIASLEAQIPSREAEPQA